MEEAGPGLRHGIGAEQGTTSCATCTGPVPARASFCPGCGTPAGAGSPSDAPRPGPTLPVLPGFTLLEPLGTGGSSVVYRARQENLHREVAIKLIREGIDDPTVWRRFEREARIIASLSGHPNVVTIYDVGRTGSGQPFLVTELLDRGSLSGVLRRDGPLDVRRAVAVGGAVAAALSAAHQQGILHRDVKPGNVLLGSNGEIKLADFGVARLMAGHTETTTASVAFTPEHVAPEVLRGDPEGAASDLYGLASTVTTALLGRPPWARRPDERVEAAMWRKLTEPPAPLGPSVPQDLRRLLAQCLAVAPEDRPPLPAVRAAFDQMLEARPPVVARAPARPLPVAPGPTPVVAADGGRPPVLAPAPRPRPSLGTRAGGGRWRAGWLVLVAVLVLVAGALAARSVLDTGDPEDAALPAGSDDAPSSGSTPSGTGTEAATDTGGAAPARSGNPPSTTATTTGPAAASPTTARPTTVSPTTVTPTTSVGTTTTPPTTTATTTATTTPAVPRSTAPAGAEGGATPAAVGRGPIGEAEATGFVRSYYDLIAAGNLRASWDMLSAGFRQARGLTFERYAAYWRANSVQLQGIRSVPGGSGPEGQVQIDARYNTPDGVVTETDELLLRRNDDGSVRISDQRIVG